MQLTGARGLRLDLTGHLILPGLINAHDHLEFNLFPRLGRGPYPNAAAWARDIYHPDLPPIRDHLRVPKHLRLLWGGLKNLLSGVTTVSHHNPYEPELFDKGFPVRVVKRYGWAHSLDFSPDLADRHRQTPSRWPFILHAAEGTDSCARQEIARLDQLSVLGPRTVLVHAVGLDRDGLALVQRRRASIIWCPTSNCFTLGRTLRPDVLRSGVPIALGTDSALTGAGDLIDEIACAHESGLSTQELYDMVTRRAATVLRLTRRRSADLVVVRDTGQSPADALIGLRPQLVLVNGAVKLASPELAPQLPAPVRATLHPIELEGRGRSLVAVDTASLYRQTTAILGNELRLAGRRVQP